MLNVSDLKSMLASGNVTVTTTGTGVQADNIDVSASLIWSSQSVLTLDAYQSIGIGRPVYVTGAGGLSLITNDGGGGGSFAVTGKGSVLFQDLSSPLTINKTAYTLTNSISSLATAIAANPSGAFALANNYDASADGTYTESPIQTTFTGAFEGLGNTISHLSINGSGYIGLFSFELGTAENLRVENAKISATGPSIAGVLAASGGNISNVFVSGFIRGEGTLLGGLAGTSGPVENCGAVVKIVSRSSTGSTIGGLVGESGNIDQSFSLGSISAAGGVESLVGVGGLVGSNLGTIENSYARGSVTSGKNSQVGGAVGQNGEGGHEVGEIKFSYATGAVAARMGSEVGGFAGYNLKGNGYIENSYWNTTTSGTDKGVGYGRKHGVVGLTTEQLQSGLPAGFDPTIWAEDPKINNGFPYLIANPPPK